MAFMFDVKVVPSSGRTGWVLDKSGNLKCCLKSPPQKGKANDELIKTLAKALSITQDKIFITMGTQSRNKRIKIDVDLTYGRFLELLGIALQMDIFK